MNGPTEEEIKAAQEAVQPYHKQINATPALLSLIADLRVQIREGCEAARNFGAEVPDDEDEPKWVVAAAVIAERNRGEAEIERLRAALKPFAEPHAMGDNYVQFAPRLIHAARTALGSK